MTRFRITRIVVVLAAAVLFAGCGDPDSPTDPGPAATTPTSNAAVAWANAVCSASSGLQAAVQDANAALADLSVSADSLEETKATVSGQAEAVQESAAELVRTLSGVPVGSSPQSAETRLDLETALLGARTAIEQVRVAADQVAAAQTAADLTAALEGLKAAVTKTADEFAAFRESLRATASSGEQAAKETFGAAPACQELTASATASP